MSYSDQVTLWKDKVKTYSDPHYAQASTLLKSTWVDTGKVGHLISMGFDRGSGVRVYVFEGQANRDRFVNAYRAFEAKPCKDPLS